VLSPSESSAGDSDDMCDKWTPMKYFAEDSNLGIINPISSI